MIFPSIPRGPFAAVAAILAMAGCSPAPPATNASPTPARPTGQGLVWRVSGGQAAFFLAGSFHLLKADDYPLPEPYETAWRESSHLVMEIPPGDAQRPETASALKRLIALPSGTLPERIAPATWQDLTAWAARTSYPVKPLETMPPWMAALTVAVTTAAQLGFKSEHGMERHFTARLGDSGKTAEGLETTLGQLGLFQQIPPARQEAMLRQALAEAGLMAEKTAALNTAWRTGDAAALNTIMSASFRDFPEIKQLLLDDRNAAWLPRLEALLQTGRPTLVLVGAGHLCGPGSLIDLLEAKGYQCVPLKTAESPPLKKAA
jgi:uncharacterized protein YbaP (TraB family)